MKGTVNAESIYGEGSKFSFSVPQKLAEPSELEKAEAEMFPPFSEQET